MYNTITPDITDTRVLLVAEHGSRLRKLTSGMSLEEAEQGPAEVLEMYVTIADRFEALIREGRSMRDAINGVLDERLLVKLDHLPNKGEAIIYWHRAVKLGRLNQMNEQEL
jgi:hypothetical protein